MVTVQIVLHHFHRLQLFQACFLGNLVFAFVSIVFQMAHIGDVAHIAHFVPQVGQVAEKDVECDGRTGVSEVCIAIDCRTAHIHAHMGGV